MKKIRIFIAILVSILIACCLLSVKPKSLICSASAQTTSATANVTFYTDDRVTPLLSIDNWVVGSSLKEFDNNNLLKNGDFDFDLSFWEISGGNFDYLFTNKGLSVKSNSSSTGYLVQRLPLDSYIGSTLTFSAFVNNNLTKVTYTIPANITNVGSSAVSVVPGLNIRFYLYSNRTIGITFDILSTLSDYVTIEYAKVEIGNIATPYYSDTYLKKLYLNSQSKYNSISDFDLYFTDDYYNYDTYFSFDFIISKDTNLYFVPVDKFISDNSYDSADYSISSANESIIFENKGQNLLNDINLSAVKYNFINFSINSENALVSSLTSNVLYSQFTLGNNFSVYKDSLGNNFYFNTVVSFIDNKYVYNNYLYNFDIKAESFYIPCFNYDLFILYDSTYGYYVPSNSNNIWDIEVSDFSITFNIDYNMQYYYADYVGFGFNLENYLFLDYPIYTANFSDTSNRFYTISSPPSSNDYGVKYFLIDSFYLRSYLVDTINLNYSVSSTLVNSFVYSPHTSKSSLISDLESRTLKFSFSSPKLYFSNLQNDSSSDSLIPTDSSGLYKQKTKWYDFTTDLYNFVIYICFDAPFISNITQLFYVLISLIKKLFDLIISLFATSNSTIFISMFFGLFLFKMLFNKIIGGKE